LIAKDSLVKNMLASGGSLYSLEDVIVVWANPTPLLFWMHQYIFGHICEVLKFRVYNLMFFVKCVNNFLKRICVQFMHNAWSVDCWLLYMS